MPAVIVYERSSGITAADRAKATSDVSALQNLRGAQKVQGPFPSKDGKAPDARAADGRGHHRGHRRRA